MRVIAWNGFKGFYVVAGSGDDAVFYHWAETIEECEKWIEENEKCT
jgi:hypothetical protein